MKMFTIYDSKAEVYCPIFFCRTIGEAERMCKETVNDGKSNFSKYPDDFCLFQLGEWDEKTGKFELLIAPYSLGILSIFKNNA